MNGRVLFVTSLLPLFLLTACERASLPPPVAAETTSGLPTLPRNAVGFIDITVEQLARSMPNKNFTLVNVHVPDAGNLPDTDLSIPFDRITENLDKLPGKDAPIVLYCRSGGMSTQAAAALAAAGYTQIYELDGGFNAWKDAGHRLATP